MKLCWVLQDVVAVHACVVALSDYLDGESLLQIIEVCDL